MNWVSREESDGSVVFYHATTQQLVSISVEANFIFQAYCDGNSAHEIAHLISKHYDVQGEDVVDDVRGTLSALEEVGLIGNESKARSGKVKVQDIVRNPLSGQVPTAPFRLFITLTRRCNLTCAHCYNDSSPSVSEQLPLYLVMRLVEEAVDIGVFELVLSGGEPLLYPYLEQILKAAKSRISVSIVSNGVSVQKALPTLKKFPPNRIQISIDGCKEKHDLVRGNGSYEKALSGARMLTEVASVSIGLTETPGLTSESFQSLCSDLLRNNIRQLNINRLLKSGRANNYSKIKSSNIDFASIANKYDIDCVMESESGKGDGVFHCGAGISILSIRSDGSVYPCSYLQMCKSQSIGSIFDNSLVELWRIKGLYEFRELNKSFNGNERCLCDSLIKNELHR